MIRAAAGMLAAALAIVATGAVQAAPFAVVLRTPPPLFKDSDSMPRIVSPGTPAAARINADLARIDAQWVAETRECRKAAEGGETYFTRGYSMRMRGPDYFALLISEEEDCGGVHPSNALTPLTYDLATGERVEWLKLFAPAAKVRRAYEPEPGEAPSDLFRSPVLHAIYLKQVRAGGSGADWEECASSLEDPELAFQIVPNAEEGAVELLPELPRVVMACGDSAYLTPADLGRLGVEPRLISALEQSHAAWLEWKKAHPDPKPTALH
jgi:hypothetical protein